MNLGANKLHSYFIKKISYFSYVCTVYTEFLVEKEIEVACQEAIIKRVGK